MSCPLDFDILISRALGELGAREAEEVGRHLAACPSCMRAAAEAEAVCVALRKLPRAEPGPGVWTGVRAAAEESRRGMVRTSWEGLFLRPYALAGAATALAVLFAVLRFTPGTMRGWRDAGLAVEEMGGTFARRSIQPGDGAAGSYFRELRAVVSETLRCAQEADEACWRGVKARVEGGRFLSRAERLSSAGSLTPAQRALAADAARLAWVIDAWPVPRLAAEGRLLAREIRRADLPGRLDKEGAW